MFEKFKVPSLNINLPAALSLYAHGRKTGLVIDSGEDVTQVVPVYDHHVVVSGIGWLNLAGKAFADYFEKLCEKQLTKEWTKNTAKDLQEKIAQDIKEKICYIAEDFGKETDKAAMFETNYELLDGNVISLGAERFTVPEALFQPTLFGMFQLYTVPSVFLEIT